MFCPKCEAQNEDDGYHCFKCGAPLREPVISVPASSPSEVGDLPEKPHNWLVASIVVTALSFFGCSCLPLGIIGIVFAAMVDGKYSSGDYEGARNAAGKAKLFTILALVIGLLLNAIMVVIWVLLVASSGGF